MSFVATWIQLDIIILSEVSQKEKDQYHMISLICGTILYTSALTRHLKNLRDE